MNQIFKIFASLLMMSIVSPKTSWSQVSPVVDGSEAEWTSDLIKKDSLHGLDYATVAANGRLFVLILIKDPMVQTKVLNAGMEVGFDIENKQKPTQGIYFPLSRVADMFSSGGFSRGMDMEAMRLLSLMQAKSYTLKKFNKGNGTFELGEVNDAGIQLSLVISEKGALVYEASVPLASLQPKKGSDGVVSKQVGLDIEIHGIEPPSEMPSYNAQPPAGGRGGGRGGAGGSGVPAGGGGRSGPGGGVRFNDGGGKDDRMKKMQETIKVHTICELK